MKKTLSIGIIIAIIATMLTSFCVKAEETQESVNPNIIYDYFDYSDELNSDTIDMSKMIVVDHSIYYLENNEYTCIEFFNTEDYAINATEITVKDYINGIPVTRVNGAQVKYIDKNCYSKLTKINIPNTVKTIGTRAFCKLKNLTELTLPKSLTKIEKYAFSGLKKITKLNLPDSITEIGECAFKNTNISKINMPRSLKEFSGGFIGMDKLKSITIPKEIKYISDSAFNSDTNLSKVIFEGDNVEGIGDFAFAYCKSLKKFKFPKKLVVIGDYAFNDSGLSGKVTLPKKCYYIAEGAFSGCKNITNVCLKGKNIEVYHFAFEGCKKLNSVIGSENIIKYGGRVFAYCTMLKNFTISKKVKYIQDDFFTKCKSMRKLKILTTNLITNTKPFRKAFKELPKKCKVYVKTYKMKNKVRKSGFKGEIFVNKKLK